jgi:hypothetical protein
MTAVALVLTVPVAAFARSSGSGADASKNIVRVQMRNVLYHFTDQIAVHIRGLQGELVPSSGSPIPVFDDKNSFTLRMSDAVIAITPGSMSNVLNAHVFAAPSSPLKDISIHIEDGELKVKGKLHSKGDIAFETDATVSVTPDGKIRLHAKKISALHVPIKGFMDLFGIEIGSLIKTGKLPGIQAEKDDLLLDPRQVLPPPRIEGKITDVRLEANNIVQVFGNPAKLRTGNGRQNYMHYEGNQLRFGKLTMSDTDLMLLDMDPRDPFDFNLDHYREQLVAGYTKTTPSFGLRVYMRDFEKLKSARDREKVGERRN